MVNPIQSSLEHILSFPSLDLKCFFQSCCYAQHCTYPCKFWLMKLKPVLPETLHSAGRARMRAVRKRGSHSQQMPGWAPSFLHAPACSPDTYLETAQLPDPNKTISSCIIVLTKRLAGINYSCFSNSTGFPEVLAGSASSVSGMTVYRPPFEEFELQRVAVAGGSSTVVPANQGPMILLVQHGKGAAVCSTSPELTLAAESESIGLVQNPQIQRGESAGFYHGLLDGLSLSRTLGLGLPDMTWLLGGLVVRVCNTWYLL